jgi:hypothetical protein
MPWGLGARNAQLNLPASHSRRDRLDSNLNDIPRMLYCGLNGMDLPIPG